MASLETKQTVPLTLWEDGSIRVGGSRVTLDCVVRQFIRGATAEQIQDDFPSLSLREVYGAISYYLDHESQVADYLRLREEEAESVRHETEDRRRASGVRRRVRDRYAKLDTTP